jgi:DNA-binding beta-propeller fold protein YncE
VTTYSCCNSPDGVAVDQVGNVWATNYFGDSISELSNSGIVLVNGKTGGGLVRPQGIAVDGAGTLWVANSRTLAGGLSELSGSASTAPGTPLSPNGGLGADVGAVEPYAVAIRRCVDVQLRWRICN